MNICESFGLTVPPELVFDGVLDPDTAARWLPLDARVERLDEHRLRVVVGRSEYEVSHDVDAMRVSWRPVATADPHGTAVVQDGPAGGTLIRVTVTTADSVDSPRLVHAFLDRLMRGLESDLGDRLSAG
jgi:uncharacterized protein YndB with AHSA1/START domain